MKNAELLEQSHGKLPGMDGVNARYFMAIRIGVTISVLKAWLDGGCKESTKDLLTILKGQSAFLPSKIL